MKKRQRKWQWGELFLDVLILDSCIHSYRPAPVSPLTLGLWQQINSNLHIHRCCRHKDIVIVSLVPQLKVPKFLCQSYWFYLDLELVKHWKCNGGTESCREENMPMLQLQDWTTGQLLVICQSINNLAGIFNWFSKLNVPVLVLQLLCCWWVLAWCFWHTHTGTHCARKHTHSH